MAAITILFRMNSSVYIRQFSLSLNPMAWRSREGMERKIPAL